MAPDKNIIYGKEENRNPNNNSMSTSSSMSESDSADDILIASCSIGHHFIFFKHAEARIYDDGILNFQLFLLYNEPQPVGMRTLEDIVDILSKLL